MHQLPRQSGRAAGAATNPTTNPERTNNSRETPSYRSRSSQDLGSYNERAQQEGGMDTSRNAPVTTGALDKESQKLNQIIQNFYTKSALTICSARANLPKVATSDGEPKMNRWFSLVLEDTNVLVEDLRPWKRANLYERRPQPLVVEVYIDNINVPYNQALVLVDEAGKRWDVADTLGVPADFDTRQSSRSSERACEVVLERWTIELGKKEGYDPAELEDALPNVYKKGVVVFRSLYAMVRFLPTWKLHKKCLRQPGGNQALKVKFRIRQGTGHIREDQDTLYTPLCPSEQGSRSMVGTHSLTPLLCSSGPLSITVDYRSNCEFQVDDAESLLSSRFLGLDTGAPAVQPGRSLPGAARSEQARAYPGSLGGPATDQRPRIGAYGSLGTFHGFEKRGSPVAELRQRMLEDEAHYEESDRPGSRQDPQLARRPSVSLVTNPPFKAGSLASSPRSATGFSTSAGRFESYFSKVASTSASKRMSLNALPQQALRTPSLTNETAIASSTSASPKPAPVHRYSSSFANRNRRFTTQSSKTGESNISSGQGGSSSSSKEKSGQLNDLLPPGSAGSGKSGDEDDIASFISQIESVKDLPSFRSRPAASSSSSARGPTTVDLAKYTTRRDPNLHLAEEMSASSLVAPHHHHQHTSSITPPSRRLSNVPGLSTSSSPSRVLAHMPHVRSRLSTHSIVEESLPVGGGGSGLGSGSGGAGTASGVSGELSESPRLADVEEPEEDYEEPFIFAQDSI